MNHVSRLMTVCALTTMLAACGGGGGGGSTAGGGGGGGGGGTTTKTATVAFSAVSTATLPAPIQGITLVAKLPAGTSVATGTGNLISTSALSVGTGITDPNLLVYGTYSAAANKVKIGIISTSTSFRGGEFARLTVSYPSTTTLTASDFTNANLPAFPLFDAAGSDGSNSVLTLTDKLAASLGVTFN